jgi:signal transduction histidine kinase
MTLNIRHQFLAYTLGIVLAVAAGLAARAISDSHSHEVEGFRQEAEVVTTMLAGSLANDIYFLDLASIERKLRGSRVNPAIVSAHVFGPQGTELASSGREEMGEPTALLADPPSSDKPLVKESRSFLDTVMPVRLPDGALAGYVAVRFSLDRVYEHMREATRSVMLATAVAVLLAGLLALIVSWYFTRPILAIKDAALAVSGGALATRSTLRRTDEIGQLSASINTMADSLVARLTELEAAQVDLRLAKDASEAANREISELNQTLERRVAERTAELREAQQSLVQKERLSALGQLTATVAHELRNPLSVIQNTLFTLRQSLESKGVTLERPIARIERSIGRCNRIISDLLDFSRQRELQCQEHPIDDWLARVLAEQVPPPKVVIRRDLQAGAVRVRFDPERLRRVAINLIDNAAQAFADQTGGADESVIVVGTRASADGVEIFVRDNGPGIPADVLPKIFEPLFSTKSFGTGLGLPTVKQIVEAHGGNVDVSSAAGEGTCVRAWLPMAAERTAA